MPIVGLLGGWRAAGFAVLAIIAGGYALFRENWTIPRLRSEVSELQADLQSCEAQKAKAVFAVERCVGEVKRITQDAEAERARYDAATKAAAEKARASTAQLEALKKDLANAKAEDDGPVARSLSHVLDGLRRAP